MRCDMVEVTIKLRLANVMGLDADNAQHNVAITEALHGISEAEEFIQYCRDHKNGIEYETKVEKLDTLATRFKKSKLTAQLPHDTANTFTSTIVKKIEVVRIMAKNEIEANGDVDFSKFKVNGEKYFTKKEVNALKALGCSSATIIGLHETFMLKDELYRLYMDKFAIQTANNLLTDNQKKIQKLTQGLTA